MELQANVLWEYPLPGVPDAEQTLVKFKIGHSPSSYLPILRVTKSGKLVDGLGLFKNGYPVITWTFTVGIQEFVALFVKGELQVVCNVYSKVRVCPGANNHNKKTQMEPTFKWWFTVTKIVEGRDVAPPVIDLTDTRCMMMTMTEAKQYFDTLCSAFRYGAKNEHYRSEYGQEEVKIVKTVFGSQAFGS